MGSTNCCQPTKTFTNNKKQILYLNKIINHPSKPPQLTLIQPIEEEDEFSFQLIIDQYQSLIILCEKRKSKSQSPSRDFFTIASHNKFDSSTQIGKCLLENHKRTKSLTTKVSTQKESITTIQGILKKRKKRRHDKNEVGQTSFQEKSLRSVHFNVILSPKNSINRKDLLPKMNKFLIKTFL